MRRLVAALGIGFVAEGLMVFVYLEIASKPAAERWWTLFSLTQEPAFHLVTWLVDTIRPGFEAQTGYIYLVPVIQWLIYAAAIYAVLWYRARRLSPK